MGKNREFPVFGRKWDQRKRFTKACLAIVEGVAVLSGREILAGIYMLYMKAIHPHSNHPRPKSEQQMVIGPWYRYARQNSWHAESDWKRRRD